jgi:hypothetical protein
MQQVKGIKTKQILIALAALAALGIGYYYFFIVKNSERSPSVTQQEETSVNDLTIKKLADAYQATIDWEKNSKFTIQLQENLVTEKSLLFNEAYLEDIFRGNDKNIVSFSIPYFYKNSYILELECSQEIVGKILKDQDTQDFYPYDGYAVVAKIQEISRQSPIEMSGSVYLNEDDLSIDVESSDTFTLKGNCIDVEYLESD